MKPFSILFILGSLMLFNSDALAQRGGDSRGSSGDSKGDSGSSRGDSDSRSSSSSSSGSDYGSSSSSSDYGSSSSCCDSYSGGDYGGSYGGGRVRVRKPKVTDYAIGEKVELISTGDKGIITYVRKTLFSGYVCIEFDVDQTEECGFKANMIKKI